MDQEHQNRILLPIGCSNLFYAMSTVAPEQIASGTVEVPFGFHPEALSNLVNEFISQGAVEIAIDPYSAFYGNTDDLPASLRDRILVVDHEKDDEALTRHIFGAIASELGFETGWIEIISDPLVGPQRRLLEIKDPDMRSNFIDLICAFNFTYHLVLGIRHRLQIDVPIFEYHATLKRLRRKISDPNNAAKIAFIEGAIGTYNLQAVGALDVVEPAASDSQKRSFERFLKEEEYQQYSELRHALGVSDRVVAVSKELWTQALRVVRLEKFRGLLNYGVRVASVSSGLPLPTFDLFRASRGEPYAPPIVRLTNAISAARQQWLEANQTLAVMSFGYEGYENIEERLFVDRGVGTFTIDTSWFIGMFTFGDGHVPNVLEPSTQKTLMRYFTINLMPPYICPVHRDSISMNDVTVNWSVPSLEISIRGCCERAMKEAWVQMSVFDSQKKYND